MLIVLIASSEQHGGRRAVRKAEFESYKTASFTKAQIFQLINDEFHTAAVLKVGVRTRLGSLQLHFRGS